MADKLGPNDCQGSYRSNASPKVGRINGVTFTQKAVKYAAINNVAIFEGDIAIGKTKDDGSFIPFEGATVLEGIGISGSQFRWPNKTVPYVLPDDFEGPERVTKAIAHWHAKTKIRFVPRTNETDFVMFINDDGCYSSVGRQGGRQDISLGSGCTTGNAIHEMGHTIGLWHEQSREDRENFITIHLENCTEGMEHNFDQHVTDGDDLGPYDYGSIMHYPRNAFSKNGDPTIVPVDEDAEIGQRIGLSPGDIAAVAQMYPDE